MNVSWQNDSEREVRLSACRVGLHTEHREGMATSPVPRPRQINVRPFSSPCVFALLVAVLPGQFTTASSQSQIAFSTCPDLRLVRVDSLRRLFNSSEIENFEDCYTSFNSSSQRLSQASTLVNSTVNSYLVAVERLVQGDCSAGDRNESKTNTSNRGASTCSFTSSALIHLNRIREDLNRWTSNCISATVLDNSALFSEAEKVELHWSMCFNLLSSLVNQTKGAVMAYCECVQNINFSPDHTCAANRGQSTCSTTGLLLLDSLLERFTSQACVDSFLARSNETFTRLETVDGQLRASFSVEETANINDTTVLTVSQQAVVVLCHSAFPFEDESLESETGEDVSHLLRLCENTCHQLRNILNVMTDVLDPGKSPLIVFLREQTDHVCSAMTQSSGDCIDLSRYLTLFQRPSSTPREQFCLNYSCHFPLRRTSNPNHWIASTQAHLKTLFDLSRAAFPSATLPLNGSLLPCGMDCTSVIHAKEEERAARIVSSVMGFVNMFTNMVAIVAYFLNRKKLRHTARRLNVYLNVAYVFGPSWDMMLAGFPSIATPRTCYSDGTLRMNEPNNVEGLTLCVVSAFMHILCINLFFFVGISMAHEWYLMLSALGSLHFWTSFEKNQKRREIVYYMLSAVISITLTVFSPARQRYIGEPSRGTCSVSAREGFYVVAIPFFCACATSTVYFALGLPKLHHVYKNVQLVPNRTASLLRRSNSARQPSTYIKGVESLLKVLSLYMVFAIGSAVIPLIYSYVFVISSRNDAATERHINCRLSRCYSATDFCPPLPRNSIALVIVPDVYHGLIGVIISVWAFNWGMFWKEHWTVLSSEMRQFYATRTTLVLPNHSPNNDIALHIRQPTPS